MFSPVAENATGAIRKFFLSLLFPTALAEPKI
jgi:hypothetical protein